MPKAAKKIYDHLSFRLAEWGERTKIIDFINENFDWKLPLINRSEFFEYYYISKKLQFAIAEQDGEFVSVAGYILANDSKTPDLWVSVWVALKGANGAGLELMNALQGLTHARVVACNNIRENTCVFYRFLGWTAERLPHYYRLSERASVGECELCKPAAQQELLSTSPIATIEPKSSVDAASHRTAQPASQALVYSRLPVQGDLSLDRVSTSIRLQALGMPICTAPKHTPEKDMPYLLRRYFSFPHLRYDIWSVHESGTLRAYLVTRTVESDPNTPQAPSALPITNVLRIVDFIGDDCILPRIGSAIDQLMEDEHAEYTDCYCAGIPAETFAAAGFSERTADDATIIPNYLTPPLYENTEYFYFTNQPDQFTMFKADGDQDRPNLPVVD